MSRCLIEEEGEEGSRGKGKGAKVVVAEFEVPRASLELQPDQRQVDPKKNQIKPPRSVDGVGEIWATDLLHFFFSNTKYVTYIQDLEF